MAPRPRWTKGLGLFAATAQTPSALSSSFPSQVDPTTGNTIYQLTSTPGDNSAFYYHDIDWDGNQYLVYRNLTSPSSSSLTYQRLNLNTAEVADVTPTGQTNGGVVWGNYLYVYYRPSTSGNYETVSRYDLTTGARTDICSLDPGWNGIGEVTVNVDSSALIFVQTWSSYRQAYECLIETGDRVRLINTTDLIEHFRFHPTSSAWYTYINQSLSGLARVGVGRIDTLQNSMLYSGDAFLNSFRNFPHPFYGTDGHLWSDATWSTITGRIYAVGFTLGATPGMVTDYTLVAIDNSQWQIHFNTGPNATWFVGDGMGDPALMMGEGYIHQMFLDPSSGLATQYRLADAVGTYSSTDPRSNANAHYLPGVNLVVWSARRTLSGVEAIEQNAFAVALLPTDLKRYFSPSAGHWASTAPAPAAFSYEFTLGRLSQAQLPGQVPVYECQTASNDLLSLDSAARVKPTCACQATSTACRCPERCRFTVATTLPASII
jgi:hypothetical protein